MTVFNGMPYLKASVESILQQSLEEFDFIIVDDGSTDETCDYLASLLDPRIKIVRQPNGGTAAAANRGLELVDTEFVARMDADDIAFPDRLAKQLAFMLEQDDVGIVGSQVSPIGERGVGKSLRLPLGHDDIFDALMTGRHGLAHSSLMIRTKLLKNLGGYWEFKLIDDWDMMLRMGEISRLANIPEVLLNYRVHSGSLNGTSMLRMYRNIGYAIERAKRRQSGAEQISYEEFQEIMDNKPLPIRLSEKLHVHAMTQYRLAVAEIHGGKRAKGYMRLLYSSLCSPSRTVHRIGRMLRKPEAALAHSSTNGSNATDSGSTSKEEASL